jgi:hypothetical protein
MKTKTMMRTGALALSLLATSVMAAVSPEEAAQLGTTLTPLGGQKEGNANGSIPAWTGGLKANAAPVTNGFVGNPFENEKPLLVITPANAEQHKDKLTPGQLAMFKRYPNSYKIPVYPTHRTSSSPQKIYDIVKKNAVSTQLVNDGNGVGNFGDAHYFPFPIPKSGVEVYFNHATRYRGGGYTRGTAQAVPQPDGSYIIVQIEEEMGYPEKMQGVDPATAANVLYYYKNTITGPARLAGTVSLIHETIDQIKDPRQAWVYNAGQRRVRRAPQLAYDGPGSASDGMRTSDNADMFNGAPDRYDWKLVGKKEMYIPYNNYKLQSPDVKYADILKPGHINQDLSRYELHRVWHVEATLKPSQRHIYAKRDMYFDEDSWTLVEADHYDGRGQLWRVAEGYPFSDYVNGISVYAVQSIADLVAGRYVAFGMMNETGKGPNYDVSYKLADFTPSALRNAGVR